MILGGSNSKSQSLSVFNVDTTAFPAIKAKLYAFDSGGKQILNLNSSDFEVKENGVPRVILSVSCPSPKPPASLSSVLVMDVSGSMCEHGLDIAKAAANVWIDMMSFPESECAITSFSDINYLNQDFTKNKTKLIEGINSLACKNGTNYDEALLNPSAGGILIAKSGKYNRVIVFLTDGGPNFIPKTAKIISQAKASKITIYCVTVNMKAPQCLKDFANQTGGICFENIRTKEEVEDCYRKILFTAQSGNPCSIEWESDISCFDEIKNVEIKLIPNNTKTILSYQPSYNSVAKLEFNPPTVNFENAQPGVKKNSILTVTARNANFNVTNITSSNAAYLITPVNFNLTKDQSINLTVSYVPADSGYTYCKYDFINDKCKTALEAKGGFKGKKPKIKTLKLINPNGGQVFVVGKDTVITWEGVLSDEIVKIDYSTNNGENWLPISKNATGLSYKWRVPKTPGNQCLARVTAKLAKLESICQNGDVKICNQTWMGCNLDVDTYLNGDIIPEVEDLSEWANLVTGAWCYWNNDPEFGAIYGKLYNWYALNDPRGLAPSGYHLPSDEEWTELENCLGGSSIAGGKLKEANLKHWLSPNINATDEIRFTALPGGWRFDYGSFYDIGYYGSWWSSTQDHSINSWSRHLNYSNGRINRYSYKKGYGFSVRCVRDK
jgi:uncharacterized protein (TIGR02145 family)